ncbi:MULTISPECIES: hypothetical protein [Streptomyces violaceusniger group]|uniref:Uncharacterized protein n=2 Tax=Streptomyces javensis TaxID=114698 RepID=A0ABS0RND2_9ACTN|nr:hypothetical protein [Streptomyces javensis]MBI0318906.1 hypothetical protein [Streptomyces javensis]
MSAHDPVAGTGAARDDRSPSMSELLAACAAASAVSTPPRPAEEETGETGETETPASVEPEADDEERDEERDAA